MTTETGTPDKDMFTPSPVSTGTKTSTGTTSDKDMPEERPWWVPVIVAICATLMSGIIMAPLSLSGQDLLKWARADLDLEGGWPWVVFYSLDATAIICVLMCLYCAYAGLKAGLFNITVWAIAVMSAWAQYGHGMRIKETAPDAWWFFPAMALLSPFMLELVLWLMRAVKRKRQGQVAKDRAKFPLWRWIPGVGSFVETYGAWRVSLLLNISVYDECVREYRTLCPNGGFKVLAAIRARNMSQLAKDIGPVEPPKVQDTLKDISADVPEDEVQDTSMPVRANKTLVPVLPKDMSNSKDTGQDMSDPEREQAPNPKGQDIGTTENKDTGTDKDQDTPKDMSSKKPGRKRTTDEEYIAMIRREFDEYPSTLPTGYWLRKNLKVNDNKSKKLLALLEKEQDS